MAKERRTNSIKGALSAVTTAIRAEADGTLTPEAKEAVINNAMDVVDDSNFVTLAENVDEAIELKHQVEEEIEAEEAATAAENDEASGDADNADADKTDATDGNEPPF